MNWDSYLDVDQSHPELLARGDYESCSCRPTAEALELLARLPQPVIEIGAGSGFWQHAMALHGIAALGFDTGYCGPRVTPGSHELAALARGTTLLAVWPPDGPAFNAWAGAKAWRDIVLVGDLRRLHWPATMARYDLRVQFEVPDNLCLRTWLHWFARAS